MQTLRARHPYPKRYGERCESIVHVRRSSYYDRTKFSRQLAPEVLSRGVIPKASTQAFGRVVFALAYGRI